MENKTSSEFITEEGQAVIAESDGFSYYTVEFTYDEKQYVMQGDSSVALTDILSFVGITKAITIKAKTNTNFFELNVFIFFPPKYNSGNII